MNFEELEQEWQSMKIEPRWYSDRELLNMMYNPGKRYCRSASWREIGQFFLSVSAVLLSPVYDLFSLYTLPVWAALNEIEDEHLGTRYLRSMPDDRPRPPLSASLAMMKVVLVVARLVHVCLWAALVLILIAPMGLNHGITAALVIGSLPIALLIIWWRSRRWFRKIKTVEEVVEELEKIQDGILPQRP